MKYEAIFSDGTKAYRNPPEPEVGDQVAIRIRVGHGKSVKVELLSNGISYPMYLKKVESQFDYYEIKLRVSAQPFPYLFRLEQEGQVCYYDRLGAWGEQRWEYSFMILPGFSTPEWAKGAVMYQILVDRFANGDTTNDVQTGEYYYIKTQTTHVVDWDKAPEDFGVAEFYGGDLEGVRQKLYYLKSLGVEVIYFNPIFVSPSNHKYDIADYDSIDPHYGKIVADGGENLSPGDWDNTHATKYIQRVTDKQNLEASNEFFAQFVSEAHEKGIRVILDGVFNHCGSFNKWLDRERIYAKNGDYEPGAYITKDSPYHSYFGFGNHEDLNSYEGWWGHDTLPKLNYEGSKALYDYILEIGKKWVSPPYNADGWRLDVAADLGHSGEFNHQFWRDFRDAVKEANPNAIILAEHYGDPSSWLGGDQWDTVMNYDAFMEPLSYFLTGMEKHSDAYDEGALGNGERFKNTMQYFMTKMTTPSLHCSMNQLSNHDHSRFLTRTNHRVGRASHLGKETASMDINMAVMKEAVMVQMTWPGAPTLYYGDEAGVCGYTDPDNRRTYPWNNANYPLIDYHRDMIQIHKMSKALRKGSFIFLECGKDFISYGRFVEDEQYIVVINGSKEEMTKEISVYLAEVPFNATMTQAIITNEKGYSIMPQQYPVKEGMLEITLGEYTGIVLKCEK